MGKRWKREDFPKTNWNLREVLLEAVARHVRHPPDDAREGRVLPPRRRRRRREPRLRQHAARASRRRRSRTSAGSAWTGRACSSRTTRRRSACSARSRARSSSRPIGMLKEIAEEMGRGDTFHRRDGRRVLRRAGQDRARSVLRRRGPGAHRLHPVRRVHGRAAATARRTRSTRTTSTSPRSAAPTIVPESRVIDVRAARRAAATSSPSSARRGSLHPRRTHPRARRRRLGRVVRHREPPHALQGEGLARASSPSSSVATCARTARRCSRCSSRKKDVDYSKGIAITSGVYVDDKTHIEVVRYPAGLGRDGAARHRAHRRRRQHPALAALDRERSHATRCSSCARSIPFGWARKTAILLVMQPVDNHLRYKLRRRWYWPFGKKLDSDRGDGPPVPVYIPVANLVAQEDGREDGRRHPAERHHRGAAQQGLHRAHPRRLPDRRSRRRTASSTRRAARSATRTSTWSTARSSRRTSA